MALAKSGLDDPVTILRSLYMNRPALRAKEHLRLYILAAVAGRKAALYCQAAESRRKARLYAPSAKQQCVAGMEGFEPSNDGVKVRCLTTWLHPSISQHVRVNAPVLSLQHGRRCLRFHVGFACKKRHYARTATAHGHGTSSKAQQVRLDFCKLRMA